MIQKYVKVFRVGDRNVKDIFDGPVIVEEKLDGSQFRIYIKDGEMKFGSHRVNYDDSNIPDKMFNKAIESAMEHFKDLKGEWMIYCEFIAKPKHNTLCYERVPEGYLVIYDIIDSKNGIFWEYEAKKNFAEKCGLTVPQLIYEGEGSKITTDMLDEWANNTKSMLGGQIVEGVVIKNYTKSHEMECFIGMPLISKYVRTTFTEINHENHKSDKDNIFDMLGEKYKSTARWDKAIQRLEEEGKLTNNMSDLRYLIPEVGDDILEEEGDEIKNILFEKYIRSIKKYWTQGLPEYYQKHLMEKSMEDIKNDNK